MTITMKKTFMKTALASGICAIVLSLSSTSSFAASADQDYAALEQAQQWDFLNQYCTECHNFDDYSGGLDFTTMFVDEVPQNAATWEMAIRKLNAGMMPPISQEKPPVDQRDAFVAWLESYLDQASSTNPPSHRIAMHRLNRKEYVNAIRDLVGLDIDPAAILPEDDSSHGFDNIAEALQVSPSFINQYVSAARSIMAEAVGDKTPGVGSMIYTPSQALAVRAQGGGSQQFHIEGLPLGTRGGLLVEHSFPVDAEYVLNISDLAQALWVYNMEFENHLIVTLDGELIYETNIGGEEDMKAIDVTQDPAVDAINARLKDIRFTTTAGPHRVGVTFVRRTFAESDDRLQHFIPGSVQDRILSIRSFEIRGPYNPTGLGSTPSRDRIFSCYPTSTADEQACADSIINDFAARAFRRPVTPEDTAPLFEFYQLGYDIDGFEEGIRRALTRTLASPNFLYRSEITPADQAPGSIYQLGSLELASRLAFFLWSSLPDQELLDLANADKLHDPQILEQQVRRMLANSKSTTLASNFIYQWFDLAKLDEITPDGNIFPYASGAGDLRPDFKTEIELFADSVFREDQSVIRLMDANYSYLNERLALHYGITTVKGNRFRRVELEDSTRWGLMGTGGLLMVSSYPNRTSPVLRGNYILEKIMGTPPPVPPPDVEDLAENEVGQPPTTVRERLEKHRANPVCNSCHAVSDPLGFALENFDATGRWRDRDRYTGTLVDASGVLPSGKSINGPDDLREALLERSAMFVQILTEKLLAYALGRDLEASDMSVVRSIVRNSEQEDYRFSAIVLNIINSQPFQMRMAPTLSSSNNSDDIALND